MTEFPRSRRRPRVFVMDGESDSSPLKLWVRRLDEAIFWGLCALLCFAPLAYGAVEPWSMAVLEGGAVLLFLLWGVRSALNEELLVEFSPLFLPMALFAMVIVAQWILSIPAYMQAMRNEAILYVAYALLIFLATQVLRDEDRQLRFLIVLSVFGFLVAVFAIVQDFTSNGLLYWFRKPRQESAIFGPYVNHNHYAGFMEMLTPLPLLLALCNSLRGGQRMIAGFAAMVMGGSIVLSVSRAGAASFITQLLFLGVVVFAQKRSRQFRLSMAGVVLATAIFLFWMGMNRVMDRWMPVNVHAEMTGGRLAVTRDALFMGAMKPVLGWGLGNFPYVYPQFRSFYTDLFVNQAHNDYAQVWAETGIAGTAAMLWFLIVLLRAGMRRASRWRNHTVNVRLAAFTGCLGILAHSFADFNLHIPANAALFFVLCALAVLPSDDGAKVREMPVHRPHTDDGQTAV